MMVRRGVMVAGTASIALLLALAGTGWSDARPPVALDPFRVPTALTVVASALAGAAVTWAGLAYGLRPEARWQVAYAALLPVVAVVGCFLLVAGAPALSGPRAGAALLFGALALVAGFRCLESLAAGEPIGFESHWGGLGGGSGGWRLSPAAALAILTLAFVGGALVALTAETAGAPAHGAPPAGASAGTDRPPAASAPAGTR